MKRKFKNWVKYLFLGGLICTGISACSDDVLEGEGKENLNEKSSAYLSVAFSANSEGSSRSTADDATNNGDTHGGAENSGHVNIGSDAENKVNSALVVVLATDKSSGFAKLYDAPDGGFVGGLVANDIKLSATTYDVLVVVNPYTQLTASSQGINGDAGLTDVEEVKVLYKAILDGKTPDLEETVVGGNWNNFSSEAIQLDESKNLKGVMMANKDNMQVTLSAEEEKKVTVKVERVTSKITFRPKNKNVYTVNVIDLNSVEIEAETGADGKTVYNKATYKDTDGVTQTIWVVLDEENKTTTVYTKDENGAFLQNESITSVENLDGFKYVYKTGSYNTIKWYVKLEKYALVNLSKNVYNVRHTKAENSPAVPFGELTGSNYLYTPNWKTKINDWTINDVEFTEEGKFNATDFKTNTWFYNTLADVSEDSKNAENNQQYFAELKADYTPSNVDEVTGSEHYESDPKLPEIGNLLAYCLENSTVEDKQTHGLSTGISFMAKIYSNEACTTPINTLYRYNGYLFQSIDAIKQAYDIDVTKKTEWADIDEDSTADELAKVNVVKYDGNTCYYYTTEIKHYDNGVNNDLGNMEFAIMRNNIYSLSVNGINIIGDPYVDPIPSTPDEVDSPKLDVAVEILPWIVRYHDIEFN